MPFCVNCGEKLMDSARFCHSCGTPSVQPSAQSNTSQVRQPVPRPPVQQSTQPVAQPVFRQEVVSPAVVFKYQKSAMFMMLTEALDISIDGQLHFRLAETRDICYNMSPGSHTLTAYVPYIGGMKYGVVTKDFTIRDNEILEILYKPPAAVFMQGILMIRKVR